MKGHQKSRWLPLATGPEYKRTLSDLLTVTRRAERDQIGTGPWDGGVWCVLPFRCKVKAAQRGPVVAVALVAVASTTPLCHLCPEHWGKEASGMPSPLAPFTGGETGTGSAGDLLWSQGSLGAG